MYCRLDFTDEQGQYSDYLYRRPYYRIAPYIIGLGLGDILVNLKSLKIKIPRVNTNNSFMHYKQFFLKAAVI